MNSSALSVKTDDFDTIGERLRRAREIKNLSVEQVAQQVGVEVETLKTWESDQEEPRSNRLTMLAGILGTSPSWLLFGRGESPEQDMSSLDAGSLKLKLEQLKSQRDEISAEIEITEAALQQAAAKNSD